MNPYAPPGDPADTAETGEPGKKKKRKKPRGSYYARLEGDPPRHVLVVGRDIEFPGVCLKCGSHQEIVRREAKFQWTPPWARMTLICGLIGLIAMMITTKRAQLGVPLCANCNKRWSAARNALVGGTVVLVASIVALLRIVDDPKELLPLAIVAILAFVILAFAYARPRMVQAGKIDENVVELKGCHLGAAQEIAEGSS